MSSTAVVSAATASSVRQISPRKTEEMQGTIEESEERRKSARPLSSTKLVEYGAIELLSSDCSNLVNNSLLSDIKFVLGSEKRVVHAHKVILVQRCQYFRSMFLNGMSETYSNVIERPDVSPDIFLKIMQYVYSGKISLSNESALHILAIADEFQLMELKKFCVTHVKDNIDIESSLRMLDLAYKYCSEELVSSCYDFIKHNTAEVVQSRSFILISKDTLMRFLESEYLAIDEIFIFLALVRWGLQRIVDGDFENAQESATSPRVMTNDNSYLHYINLNISNLEEEVQESLFLEEPGSAGVRNSIDFDAFVEQLQSETEGQGAGTGGTTPSTKKKTTTFQTLVNAFVKEKRQNNRNATISETSPVVGAAVQKREIDFAINAKTALELLMNYKFSKQHKENQQQDIEIKNTAMRLCAQDKQILREVIKDLVPFVRFPLMTSYQLTDMVEPWANVPDWLLLEAYRHIAAPERSLNVKRAKNRKGLSDQLTQEFEGSTILTHQHKSVLSSWCENVNSKKRKKWVMQYKAARDGFAAKRFHELCDNTGPTITVCRTTDGYIFGGFNSASWSSNNSWVTAYDTFIFSLINPFNDGPRKLKVKNASRAIYNSASFGPCFGGGGYNNLFDPHDIYIDSSMTKGHTNVGNSYATFRGGFRSEEAQKSLAGSLNSWTLNDVEVFALV